MSFVIAGLISLALAIVLAVKGIVSTKLTPVQRVLVLFGAAALSVPGLYAIYFLFVLAVLVYNTPF